MKWRLSLPKPPMLVYYFAKFCTLAPFTVNNERFYPPTLLEKLYTVFVGAAHFIISILLSGSALGTVWLQNTIQFWTLMSFFEISTSLLTTSFTIMIFLVMYNKILYIMNKLSDIGNELKILGIEENLDSFFNNILVITICANVTVVSTYVTLTLLETNWPINFMISSSINTWFHVNMILIFVKTLSLIEKRFKLVNEKLDDIVGTVRNFRPPYGSQILVVRENSRRHEYYNDAESVRIIEGLHMELCDLIDRLSNLFAIPILLKSFHLCILLTACCYWIYFEIRNLGYVISAARIISILRTLINISITIVQPFFIARASAKTCKEGNSTRAVISKARYTLKPQELEDEFCLFSLQLLHRPVTVSALGFFHLGYSYVYEMICTVVAYSVILIQFNTF